MIVRDLTDAEATDRRVVSETWESTRLLLRSDQMGFSLHVTKIYAGTITSMWYRNHLEAVLCIEGEGEIQTVDDRKVYQIRPGVMYALDQHDQHILTARTQMRLVCVFNPPVIGKEVHDEDGAYPLEADEVND
jgi:L-ectoine synthase